MNLGSARFQSFSLRNLWKGTGRPQGDPPTSAGCLGRCDLPVHNKQNNIRTAKNIEHHIYYMQCSISKYTSFRPDADFTFSSICLLKFSNIRIWSLLYDIPNHSWCIFRNKSSESIMNSRRMLGDGCDMTSENNPFKFSNIMIWSLLYDIPNHSWCLFKNKSSESIWIHEGCLGIDAIWLQKITCLKQGM